MEEQKEHLAKELNSMLTVAKNYGIEKMTSEFIRCCKELQTLKSE